jgi:SEC-C motif
MSLRNVMGLDSRNTEISQRAEIIRRYKELRKAGRHLNNKLVRRLSKDDLDKGGKKLGFLRRGALVFDTEDETSVLMDYCLYDVRRNGRNAIEQYLIDEPPDPDSDEMVYLRAMQHAVYSVFVVESVHRGLGVTIRDSLSGDTHLMADMGFGASAQPGLVFASRLLFQDGFTMSGGAALPLGILPKDQQETVTKALWEKVNPNKEGYFDPAPIISTCLSKGCSSLIEYQHPDRVAIGQQPAVSERSEASVGRNELCPCGSGKKFKRCCIKRS